MYTEQDLSDVNRQLRGRFWALGAPAALLLGGIIVSFVFRVRWLTYGLSLLLGAGSLFCWGLLISPVLAYRRHLDSVLHGRTRVTSGQFKEMEPKAVEREGVYFYPLLLSVGDPENSEDDRLFYFDANLPRPGWQPGDALTLTAHDKAICKWEKGAA